jgi:peptidoglycan/LPS O-acetylase OafA/YrhL
MGEEVKLHFADAAPVTTKPQAQTDPIKKVKKEFINYIHNFRGLAIIFVVAGHLLLKWDNGSVTYKILRVFWENGTVLFVFIAGFLFQFLSKKFVYNEYLFKKISYVIIPYLIVSLPIIVYRLLTNDLPGYITNSHPAFVDWNIAKKIMYFVFTGAHMQQLWFVPMIVLYYVAAPLFIFVDRNSRWYFILIPLICLSAFLAREPFNDIPRMSVHFLSVYIFGMLVSHYRHQFLSFMHRWRYVVGFATVALFSSNLYFYPDYNNALNYAHKMLFCALFIYLLWKNDQYVPKFLGSLAEISFGIFFLHYYVILVTKAIYEKLIHHAMPGNLVYWSLDLFVVMFITLFVIRMTKKILGDRSRTVIGC